MVANFTRRDLLAAELNRRSVCFAFSCVPASSLKEGDWWLRLYDRRHRHGMYFPKLSNEIHGSAGFASPCRDPLPLERVGRPRTLFQ